MNDFVFESKGIEPLEIYRPIEDNPHGFYVGIDSKGNKRAIGSTFAEVISNYLKAVRKPIKSPYARV